MDGQDNRLLLERYLAALLDAEQEYALRVVGETDEGEAYSGPMPNRACARRMLSGCCGGYFAHPFAKWVNCF